jgi:hypothetical protein
MHGRGESHAPDQVLSSAISISRTPLHLPGQAGTAHAPTRNTMYAKLSTFRSYIASGKIECVYVWITKEKDTDDACYYRFDAEIYGPGQADSMRLEPVKSESGFMKVDKLKATGKLVDENGDGAALSIGARILFELRDLWRRHEFPNARFLTYCNLNN